MNPRQVKNPAALGCALGLLLLFMIAAQASLFTLARGQSVAGGALPIGARALEDVLVKSPSVALGRGEREIWVVSPIDCRDCSRPIAGLLGEDADAATLRIMLVARREAQLDEAHAISLAALARHGADAWSDCIDESRFPRIAADGACRSHISADPAEIEGYVEWGRASYDRLSAILAVNGMELSPPAVFWRDEDGWRVSMGEDARLPDLKAGTS